MPMSEPLGSKGHAGGNEELNKYSLYNPEPFVEYCMRTLVPKYFRRVPEDKARAFCSDVYSNVFADIVSNHPEFRIKRTEIRFARP